MRSVLDRLAETEVEARGHRHRLASLERLRTSALGGPRAVLPSAEREHLGHDTPAPAALSYDGRHRPVSTNTSQHFTRLLRLAEDMEVLRHTLVPLRKPSRETETRPRALFLAIAAASSELRIFSVTGGDPLLEFDLGHEPGTSIMHMQASSSAQDSPTVMTADDTGRIRVHTLTVQSPKEQPPPAHSLDNETEPGASGSEPLVQSLPPAVVTAELACAFRLPDSPLGEARHLTAVLMLERGQRSWFIAGDSEGGLSAFSRQGLFKGRIRATEDEGGIRGLSRGQGTSVLFFSSHSFGMFSATQVELMYPPCTGWAARTVDAIIDPSYSPNRVILSVDSGDVLVFATIRSRGKACDLALKFPHVAAMPLKLHAFQGYILGVPALVDDLAPSQAAGYPRELFFFNIAAMDFGYGVAPSRALAIQASFAPRHFRDLALLGVLPGGGDGAPKPLVALSFVGSRGVDLYRFWARQPPKSKVAKDEGVSAVDDDGAGNKWLAIPVPIIGAAFFIIMAVVRRKFRQRSAAAGNAAKPSDGSGSAAATATGGNARPDDEGGIEDDDDDAMAAAFSAAAFPSASSRSTPGPSSAGSGSVGRRDGPGAQPWRSTAAGAGGRTRVEEVRHGSYEDEDNE